MFFSHDYQKIAQYNVFFFLLILKVRCCQQEGNYMSCIYFFFYITQSLMNSSKEEMRELAALFYSVVVSTVSGNELKSMIEQLIKTTKDNHVCYQFCLHSFLWTVVEFYISI